MLYVLVPQSVQMDCLRKCLQSRQKSIKWVGRQGGFALNVRVPNAVRRVTHRHLYRKNLRCSCWRLIVVPIRRQIRFCLCQGHHKLRCWHPPCCFLVHYANNATWGLAWRQCVGNLPNVGWGLWWAKRIGWAVFCRPIRINRSRLNQWHRPNANSRLVLRCADGLVPISQNQIICLANARLNEWHHEVDWVIRIIWWWCCDSWFRWYSDTFAPWLFRCSCVMPCARFRSRRCWAEDCRLIPSDWYRRFPSLLRFQARGFLWFHDNAHLIIGECVLGWLWHRPRLPIRGECLSLVQFCPIPKPDGYTEIFSCHRIQIRCVTWFFQRIS